MTLPTTQRSALGTEDTARPGFNVIATANDRDRGVNELSSALRRRFNTVVLPLPETPEAEVDIDGKSVSVAYDETVVDRAAVVRTIESAGYAVAG